MIEFSNNIKLKICFAFLVVKHTDISDLYKFSDFDFLLMMVFKLIQN